MATKLRKSRMAEFGALRNLGVDEMPPRKIRSLREKAHGSQRGAGGDSLMRRRCV